MRTCTNCGASVADTDEFCASCGTYLAWLKPEPAGDAPAESPAESPAEQPQAVAPAQPVAPPRPTATEAAEPDGDGPRCTNCGTVNRAGANFCRQCGTALTEAPAATPAGRHRHRRLRGSGGSPWPRRIAVLVIAAVLVVAGFLLYPYGVNVTQDVLDKLGTPTPIAPSGTTGSAAVPGHPVGAAVDGVSNQYWGAPSVGGWAQFTFPKPFRLLGVVITPGASTDPTAFEQEARPTKVDLVITTSDGTSTTLPIDLADKPGSQTTDTGISDVTTIRLVIRAAADQGPGRVIALGEVEFFQRS